MEKKNIPKGTLKITFANTVQYIIIALFYVIVTKTNTLTDTEIGNLSILNFVASTFSLLTLLALPIALTKFTSEKLETNQKDKAAETQKTIITAVIAISITGLIIAVLSSQFISQYLFTNTEFIILVILNFIFAFLFNIRNLFDSFLNAFYLFGKVATLTIAFITSSRIIAIILVFLDLGVTGVIIGYIIGSMISISIGLKFLHKKFPRTSKYASLKPIFHFSLPLFITSLTNLILNWADIVIITSLTGNYSIVGIYSITVSSVGTLALLYLPMMTTIFPAISAHYGRKKIENIINITKTTSRIVIFIILPSCVGLAIIARTALTFFYNSSYAAGSTSLAILSIGTILIAITGIFTTTLTAIGKTGQRLKIDIISAISLILMLFSFVPFLDLPGAAFARLLTQLLALVLTIYILRKEIKITLDKEALWKATVCTIPIIPVLFYIEMIISKELSIVPTLALELLTAVGIYAFSLYILKALKPSDFDLLRQAVPKPLTKYITILEHIIIR